MSTVVRRSVRREPLKLAWVFPGSLFVHLAATSRIETASALNSLGWQVELINKYTPGSPEQVDGVKIVNLKTANVYFLRQVLLHFAAIRYILQRWQSLDVVLFDQTSGLWILPLSLLRFLTRDQGPRLVLDIRDFDDASPGNLKIQARLWMHQFVLWMANYLADGYTVITSRMGELVNIPPEKLWGIWPSGVKPDAFSQAAKRRRWPEEKEPVQLIYVGVLLEKRHPMDLCKAVLKANQDGMKFNLTFVGSGSASASLAAYEEASEGRIRVYDPVPHDRVPDVLAGAHVGVTSLADPDDVKYQASSPIKLFEYMASGLAILTTSNVCHTDVVGKADYAFWIDTVDSSSILSALKDIWNSRFELDRIGREAEAAVENWTWQASAEALDEALRDGLSWKRELV